MSDPVAVMVKSGWIVAVLKLPAGILLWSLFTQCCMLVPSEMEEGDVMKDLIDVPGIKFFELAEFCLKYASEFSPQA